MSHQKKASASSTQPRRKQGARARRRSRAPSRTGSPSCARRRAPRAARSSPPPRSLPRGHGRGASVPGRCARRHLATRPQAAGSRTTAATSIPSPPAWPRRRAGWGSRAVPGGQRSTRTEPAPRRWLRSCPPIDPAAQLRLTGAPRTQRHSVGTLRRHRYPSPPADAGGPGTEAEARHQIPAHRNRPSHRLDGANELPLRAQVPSGQGHGVGRPGRRRCSSETSSPARSSPADSAARPRRASRGRARTSPRSGVEERAEAPLGESRSGRHSQSIDPSKATSATVRPSPIAA